MEMRVFEVGPALLAFAEAMLALPVGAAAQRTMAAIPLAADALPTSILATILATLASAWSTIVASIRHAHAHAPALVLGLAALLAIPPLAVIGHLLARRRAAADRARRLAGLAPASASADADGGQDGERTSRAPSAIASAAGPLTSVTGRGDGMTWPVDAWLTIEGGNGLPFPIVRELVRIGREDDNDIVLPHPTVHRYHAVVQRTDEAEIVVLDLSGEEGNGVLVNAKRVSRQRLRSGDRIGIGREFLTFEARRI